MEQELAKALENLSKQIAKPVQKNIWLDYAVKVATGVTAAGVIAIFTLFTTQLPRIQRTLDKVEREQIYVNKALMDLKEFTKKPRFGLDDFNKNIDEYDDRLRAVEQEQGRREGIKHRVGEIEKVLRKKGYME